MCLDMEIWPQVVEEGLRHDWSDSMSGPAGISAHARWARWFA